MVYFDFINTDVALIEKQYQNDVLPPDLKRIILQVAKRFAKFIPMRETALAGFVANAMRDTEAKTLKTFMEVSKDPKLFPEWDEMMVNSLFTQLYAVLKKKNTKIERELMRQIARARMLIKKAFVVER